VQKNPARILREPGEPLRLAARSPPDLE